MPTFNPRIDHKPNPSIVLEPNTEPPADLAAGKTFQDKLDVFVARVFGPNRVLRYIKNNGQWADLLFSGQLATFDSDLLTRIVFAAHEYCVQVEIEKAGANHRIKIYDRQRTGGRDGHPTIAESLQRLLYAN